MSNADDLDPCFHDLRQIATEQDRAKLAAVAAEHRSTLQQLPKLQQEMDALLAPGQLLDYADLTQSIRPKLEQAARFLFEVGELPAEMRNAPEVIEFVRSAKTNMTLQTVAPLAAKLPSICSAARQRLAREEAEASRQFTRNLKLVGVGCAVVLGLYVYASFKRPEAKPAPVPQVVQQTPAPVAAPAPVLVPATPTVETPTMVPIPAGSFTMGCVEGHDTVPGVEDKCNPDEMPAHTVNVPAFELGATEVTVRQFRAFVEATGYRTTAETQGSCYGINTSGTEWEEVKGNSWRNVGFSQTDTDPVACISWDDAQAYLKWLGGKTGQQWRLPSEAEWEYAARAGNNQDAYPWGKEAAAGCGFANIGDQKLKEKFPERAVTVADCNDGFLYTSPAGHFKANAFGLYDMQGNVWEWVQDCYQGDYKAAPTDGTAREGCDAAAARVLRGGSWYDKPLRLRSAYRLYDAPDDRSNDLGFRVARTL